ncbi:NADP-dependent oxidoreductase [Microbacterium sp. RD1]|uniref:NADP-dependent oxidoreductase n=1 Tax=Microbacterium sp. RD1 TaxID=3457313 RepID=UPI003FA54795
MAKAIVLARRPHGFPTAGDFERVDAHVPAVPPGGLLLETRHVSIDPAMRGWLDDRPSYLPPVGIGEPVRALGLARVVESRSDRIAQGAIVRGFVGWRDRFVVDDAAGWEIVPDDSTARLGVLGLTGLTAWVGMQQIAAPRAGETVVVSGVTGAVGSVAAQLARIAGARVIGVAGGEERARRITDELGLHGAVDYRADDWQEQLAELTPDGIDVDFENVGGPVFEAVIDRLNNHARIALCGLNSGYNADTRPAGPRNFGYLLTKRVTMRGFIAIDHFGEADACATELAPLLATGDLIGLETVETGFDRLDAVFIDSMRGGHLGKLVVTV